MIDYDKFGHCTKCHKNMYMRQIIDNNPAWRFTAEYVEKEYLLSDGTKMRVALCRPCKEKLTDKDSKEIMNCVINGWDISTDELVNDDKKPHWTVEKKKDYMDKYSKLEIVSDSEGIEPDVLDKKLKDFKLNKKAKKDK